MARSALAAPAADEREIADTQLVLARFYAEQLLPQVAGLLSAATAGAEDMFALTPQQL
jgi:3-(methylthio)propanoyl-CoA dehydrogenase